MLLMALRGLYMSLHSRTYHSYMSYMSTEQCSNMVTSAISHFERLLGITKMDQPTVVICVNSRIHLYIMQYEAVQYVYIINDCSIYRGAFYELKDKSISFHTWVKAF